MKGRTVLSWRDYFFLLVVVVFLFGCVASSHRSGKTLDQGQVSVGMAYDGLLDLEESDVDMATTKGSSRPGGAMPRCS